MCIRDRKAPYYLNSIFDQLKTEEDYDKFYSSIADNAKVDVYKRQFHHRGKGRYRLLSDYPEPCNPSVKDGLPDIY